MKKVLSVLLCTLFLGVMGLTAFACEEQIVASKQFEDGHTFEVAECPQEEGGTVTRLRLWSADGKLLMEVVPGSPGQAELLPQDAKFPTPDERCLHNYVVTGDYTCTIRDNLAGETFSAQVIQYTCTFCGDFYSEKQGFSGFSGLF